MRQAAVAARGDADDVVVFDPATHGTADARSGAGGIPAAAARSTETGETNHRWPHFLPGGRHFLYIAVTGTAVLPPNRRDPSRVTRPPEPRTTLPSRIVCGVRNRPSPVRRATILMAQPFDRTPADCRAIRFRLRNRSARGQPLCDFRGIPGRRAGLRPRQCRPRPATHVVRSQRQDLEHGRDSERLLEYLVVARRAPGGSHPIHRNATQQRRLDCQSRARGQPPAHLESGRRLAPGVVPRRL